MRFHDSSILYVLKLGHAVIGVFSRKNMQLAQRKLNKEIDPIHDKLQAQIDMNPMPTKGQYTSPTHARTTFKHGKQLITGTNLIISEQRSIGHAWIQCQINQYNSSMQTPSYHETTKRDESNPNKSSIHSNVHESNANSINHLMECKQHGSN